MRGAFLAFYMLIAMPAFADDEACLKWALWKEARGESKVTMRAVLDVIHNRMAKYQLSACDVLKQRGQFPWRRRGEIKTVDFAFTSVYNTVSQMEPVLSSEYIYFNHRRHPWGKGTTKIGNLFFSK